MKNYKSIVLCIIILVLFYPLICFSYMVGAGFIDGGGGGGDISADLIWDAAGDIVYGTGSNTSARLAAGTAYQILQMNSTGTAPEWTSTFLIRSLDMGAATSSIPTVIGTADATNTTEGTFYWESDDDALTIGDGATGITLDFTANTIITFPTATATLVSLDGTQTLTNKTLTSPSITAPSLTANEVFIDCAGSADPYAWCTAADASTLTAALVSRTIINSYGRGEAQTVTLPTAAAGMTFIAVVGTQHNSAWKIQRGGTDTIIYDGTAGKTYFQETNQAVGSRVSCFTFKTGAAAWTWICGGSSGTWTTD